MSLDILPEDDPEAQAYKRYHLQGRLSWPSGGVTIKARQFELQAYTERNRLQKVEIKIQFEKKCLQEIVSLWPGLKRSGDSYAFVLKPEIVNYHRKAFESAITIEDWFELGEGICLNLHNYDCVGTCQLLQKDTQELVP